MPVVSGVGDQGNDIDEGALPQVLWDYNIIIMATDPTTAGMARSKEGKHDLVVYDSAPTGKPGL